MEKNVFKKLLSLTLCAILCISFVPIKTDAAEIVAEESVSVSNVGALTQNQQNIKNRADYLYSITWVCQKTITAHAYSYYYTFYAGETYHLPYGQGPTANYIGYGVSPEGFRAAAADPNSVFYAYKSYTGSWYSSYYISDCSGFASWCWGLSEKQSTRSIANYSTYVGSVTTSNIINKLQVGDVLNRYDYHVVVVTDIKYDSAGNMTQIEITEQAVPQTLRTVYSPSGLASAYSSYDGIYRCKYNVPASPVVVNQETWQEKAAFDVMVYRDRNQDLAGMTDDELKKHWLEHGIKEGRASSPVLDLGFYLNNNQDLKDAYGTDYEKVYKHFVEHGYKEKRKSSALFDGKYYTEHYPEAAAKGDEYMKYYVEHGILAGHRASLTFDPDYYWFIYPSVWDTWPAHYEMCAKHYAGHGIREGVEAYDNKHPVISDVTISDISANGYTISCKVTDNWEIEFVSFPTWTVANDQDDLADDFFNTQRGTKNGDIYTFRVNASDHNNETGEYVTHIYAQDRGGNRVSVTPDTIIVKDGSNEITLKGSSSYVKDGNILKKVSASTAKDNFLKQFENEGLKVKDAAGNEITSSGVVGTGASVELYDGANLVDKVTVIVLGDIDGNGIIDTTDYLRVKSAFLGGMTLDNAQGLAADVDGNGNIDGTDYMRIKGQFLGTFTI